MSCVMKDVNFLVFRIFHYFFYIIFKLFLLKIEKNTSRVTDVAALAYEATHGGVFRCHVVHTCCLHGLRLMEV